MTRLTILLVGLVALWAVPFVAHPLGMSGGGGGCTVNCTFSEQTHLIGDAGESGVTPSLAADLFLEDGYSAMIQIATPNTEIGYVNFADPQNAAAGQIHYNHATNEMWFATDGLSRLSIGATGALASTRACIAGYTRVDPNKCVNNTDDFSAGWTEATPCTATTPYDTLPVTAKSADVLLVWRAYSNNAAGVRANITDFYRDATCTNQAGQSAYAFYEFSPLAAGTPFAAARHSLNIPLVNESGVMKFRAIFQNGGGNGNMSLDSYGIMAYYD